MTTTTRTTTVVAELPDERRWQGRDWLKALIAGGLALALLRPGAQAPAIPQPTAAPAAAPTLLAIPSVASPPTAAPAAPTAAPGAARPTAAPTAPTVAPTAASLGGAAGASAPAAGAAPAVLAPAEGATVEPGELVVSGTGAPGAELEVLNGDLVLGVATVGDDGGWSLPVALEAGTASIGVRPAGAEEIVGVPVRVTVGDAAAIGPACAAVAVGCRAWVTRAGDLRLRLRAEGRIAPDNIIATLPIGTEMEVLEGPAPADAYTWWRVRTIGGAEGWVAGENLVLQPD